MQDLGGQIAIGHPRQPAQANIRILVRDDKVAAAINARWANASPSPTNSVGIPSTCFGETGYYVSKITSSSRTTPPRASNPLLLQATTSCPISSWRRSSQRFATVGPFSIDTYLPALHAIGEELNASPLKCNRPSPPTCCPWAPWCCGGAFSDAWGRKPVIVVSMLLFALASLVCVFAGSIETLLVGRALQGISAGAGMVVGRAVVPRPDGGGQGRNA